MSDFIDCEVCNKQAKRPIGKSCPDGWMCAEMTESETGIVYVLASCSDECRAKFWTPQYKFDLNEFEVI